MTFFIPFSVAIAIYLTPTITKSFLSIFARTRFKLSLWSPVRQNKYKRLTDEADSKFWSVDIILTNYGTFLFTVVAINEHTVKATKSTLLTLLFQLAYRL